MGDSGLPFFICIAGCFFPRREMQTTSRYASRTSASLGEGYSFIALRFGTCNTRKTSRRLSPLYVVSGCWQFGVRAIAPHRPTVEPATGTRSQVVLNPQEISTRAFTRQKHRFYRAIGELSLDERSAIAVRGFFVLPQRGSVP